MPSLKCDHCGNGDPARFAWEEHVIVRRSIVGFVRDDVGDPALAIADDEEIVDSVEGSEYLACLACGSIVSETDFGRFKYGCSADDPRVLPLQRPPQPAERT